MQLKSTFLAATALFGPLCFGNPTLAQMYPGADVNVGPAAGGQVLLYPGGTYRRVVPPLLQPGDPYPDTAPEPIHLHMPVHHVVRAAVPATKVAATPPADTTTQQPAASDTTPAPETPAAPPVRPAVQAASSSTAPPAGSAWRRKHGGGQAQVATITPDAGSAIPFSMDPDALPLATPPPAHTAPAAPPPPPAKPPASAPAAPKTVAKPAPLATAPSTQPVREASLGKPESGDHTNLTKRGAVLFDKGEIDPSPAIYHGVKVLAGALNSALESGAARIQLEAYGGTPGDKSSDARRLSLKRALAIRQLLIDNGVPSSRIDVRAMGGAEDNGPADRVDVFVRTG